MEQTPPGRFMVYAFFQVASSWYGQSKEEKSRAVAEYLARFGELSGTVTLRPYSTLGLKRNTDFLLWVIAPDLSPIQAFFAGLRKTAMAPYLTEAETFLSVTRESTYTKQHKEEIAVGVEPGKSQYLFVYPFVKSREWYLLPMETRQKLMNEHIRIGHEFPRIRINTSYSFGLDDQDFVVSFEGNDPKEFVTLVMRLRESEGSKYTVRDTPIFTCQRQPIDEILWSLG
ncbi:MAG TPA: chlorite dismutase family protein [Methylomirabilota bacterium]|nr:chlorite dismutase family protein [Methylomirabilota bacterium]